jgi:hypothetical protein
MRSNPQSDAATPEASAVGGARSGGSDTPRARAHAARALSRAVSPAPRPCRPHLYSSFIDIGARLYWLHASPRSWNKSCGEAAVLVEGDSAAAARTTRGARAATPRARAKEHARTLRWNAVCCIVAVDGSKRGALSGERGSIAR